MIISITPATARACYMAWDGRKQGVSFSDKGDWLACMRHDIILGIVSVQQLGGSRRVKTLLVHAPDRRKGIGTALVRAASQGHICTAFSTPASRSIFTKAGYEVMSVNARGVAYMKKNKP